MLTTIATAPPEINTTNTPPTLAIVSSSAPPSSAVSYKVKSLLGKLQCFEKEPPTVHAPPPRFSFHHLIFIEVISPDSCICKTASLNAPR